MAACPPEGLGLYRLRDGRCVLRRGERLHALEGVSFSLLRRVIDRFAQRKRAAAVEAVRAAGYSRAEARRLVEVLAGAYVEHGAEPARLFSGRQLERHLRERVGVEVRAWLRAPADLPMPAATPLIFIGPSRWWLGPFGDACVECLVLRFAEETLAPADEIGDCLHDATHQASQLTPATLAAMTANVRAMAGDSHGGWVCGELGRAETLLKSVRHGGCEVCRRKEPVADSQRAPELATPVNCTADAAELAQTALIRLGVLRSEQCETSRSPTFRRLPRVSVGWRRAYRQDGAIVVQEAVQVGGGASLQQRLVSARMETVERVLVGTRAPELRARSLRAMAADNSADYLDPAEWGLFATSQYAEPQFPFAPIDPDAPLDWVCAYDFAAERQTWIPVDLVHGGSGKYLPASSTGAAAHGSLEQVVVRGLLEIVEREALQLLWYRGVAPRALAPDRLRGEAAEQFTWLEGQGWRPRLVHATGRAGRHVIGVLGEFSGKRKKGLRPGGCLFTSAASGRLGEAIQRALAELVTAVEVFNDYHQPPALPRGGPDLATAWQVNDPRAIQQLYLHPAMRPALDFFLAGPLLAEPPPDRADTATDLLAALIAEGLRPLLVDCTVPDCAPLRVGKMILGGALQHSFASGQLRLGGGHLPKPPVRPLRPPPVGYRPAPGETTPYPFPLG